MDTTISDQKRRSRLPFILFLIGIGVFDFCILLTFMGVGFWFMQWLTLFAQSSVVGQFFFAILVGGLVGKFWLKGVILGSLLAAMWCACIVSGVYWTRAGVSINSSQNPYWYLFVIPAVIFVHAIPLLVCRLAFGWQLTLEPNSPRARGNFGLEELFLMTVSIASILFLCRVPQIANELPGTSILMPMAAFLGFLSICCLLFVVPTAYAVFWVKARRLRWLCYFGIGALWVLLFEVWLVLTGNGYSLEMGASSALGVFAG